MTTRPCLASGEEGLDCKFTRWVAFMDCAFPQLWPESLTECFGAMQDASPYRHADYKFESSSSGSTPATSDDLPHIV